MKRLLILALAMNGILGFSQEKSNIDETKEIQEQQKHENPRMQFKLIESKYLDLTKELAPFQEDLASFSESEYSKIKELVFEKSIPEIQESIKEGKLSYEKLCLFYLYRIQKYETNPQLSLNCIISLNPEILEEARALDKKKLPKSNHSIYGMPILLKDNINTIGMPTTAGAVALQNNKNTDDAFVIKQLKKSGALILGKANLSEWAYFFCDGCPLGYSAIGGQGLTPYGRKIFETGGSSAGSGIAVAANYAVASIGTETAGSITSPSSQNSVVGMKPTIGRLSRSGIVPISSTLDTPGPMTKNVIDNLIVFEAMLGYDAEDQSMYNNSIGESILNDVSETNLKGKRVGVISQLLQIPLYKKSVDKMKDAGAVIVEIEPYPTRLKRFVSILNIDMKNDLPVYMEKYTDKSVPFKTVADVMTFNQEDMAKRAPYGQGLFEGIYADKTSAKKLKKIKTSLQKEGREFFSDLEDQNLDVILSVNNYHSAHAAVAYYPTISLPMGYAETGEPMNLTLVSLNNNESTLYQIAMAFESLEQVRKAPKEYL